MANLKPLKFFRKVKILAFPVMNPNCVWKLQAMDFRQMHQTHRMKTATDYNRSVSDKYIFTAKANSSMHSNHRNKGILLQEVLTAQKKALSAVLKNDTKSLLPIAFSIFTL